MNLDSWLWNWTHMCLAVSIQWWMMVVLTVLVPLVVVLVVVVVFGCCACLRFVVGDVECQYVLWDERWRDAHGWVEVSSFECGRSQADKLGCFNIDEAESNHFYSLLHTCSIPKPGRLSSTVGRNYVLSWPVVVDHLSRKEPNVLRLAGDSCPVGWSSLRCVVVRKGCKV